MIGIDPDGRINHANLLAQEIVDKAEDELIGQPAKKVFPYFEELINPIKMPRNNDYEIEVPNEDGTSRILLARFQAALETTSVIAC